MSEFKANSEFLTQLLEVASLHSADASRQMDALLASNSNKDQVLDCILEAVSGKELHISVLNMLLSQVFKSLSRLALFL